MQKTITELKSLADDEMGNIDKVIVREKGHKYTILHIGDGDELLGTDIEFINGGRLTEDCEKGITHQALLQIVIDRLKYFQEKFPNTDENDKPIELLEEARVLMFERTKERHERGVLGNSGEDYKEEETNE